MEEQTNDLARTFSEVPGNGAQVMRLIETVPRFASRPYIDGATRLARDFIAQVSKLSRAEAEGDLTANLVKASSNVIATSRDWDRDDMITWSTNARNAVNAAFRQWADPQYAKTLEPRPLVSERMPAVPEEVRLRLECARAQLMSVAAYSSLVAPAQNRLLPVFTELWERGTVLYQEWKVGEEGKRGSLSLAHIGKDLTSLRSLVLKPPVSRSERTLSDPA